MISERLSSIRPFVAIAVFCAALTGSGCVHNSLGEPPTQYDLRNDGTPESKNHLYNAYRISYADGHFTRPQSMQYSAEATSDAALNYIASSEPAEDELFNPLVVLDRFHQSPSFYASIVGISTLIGAGLGIYSGLFAAGALQQIAAGGGQTLTGVTTTALFMLAGFGVGIILALPVLLLAELTVKPMMRSLAGPAYRSSATAFNDDLNARIDSAAEPRAKSAPEANRPAPRVPTTMPRTVPEAPPSAAPPAPAEDAPAPPSTSPNVAPNDAPNDASKSDADAAPQATPEPGATETAPKAAPGETAKPPQANANPPANPS